MIRPTEIVIYLFNDEGIEPYFYQFITTHKKFKQPYYTVGNEASITPPE